MDLTVARTFIKLHLLTCIANYLAWQANYHVFILAVLCERRALLKCTGKTFLDLVTVLSCKPSTRLHPQTMTRPPPCLTVAPVHAGNNALPGVLHFLNFNERALSWKLDSSHHRVYFRLSIR